MLVGAYTNLVSTDESATPPLTMKFSDFRDL